MSKLFTATLNKNNKYCTVDLFRPAKREKVVNIHELKFMSNHYRNLK